MDAKPGLGEPPDAGAQLEDGVGGRGGRETGSHISGRVKACCPCFLSETGQKGGPP